MIGRLLTFINRNIFPVGLVIITLVSIQTYNKIDKSQEFLGTTTFVESASIIVFLTLISFILLFLLPYFRRDILEKDKKAFIYLITAIILGFVIRRTYSFILPFTNDEGAYLYDGLLIAKGSSPFYFSFARSPVLIYIIGAFLKIFSVGFFKGRLLNILFSIACGIIIYKIGNLLKNKQTGLLSAAIFFVVPTITFDTIYLHTQTIEYFFIFASFYLVLKGATTNKHNPLVWSSISLGLAALIREVAVFYFPLIVFIVFWKLRRDVVLKIIAKMTAYFLVIVVGVWSLVGIQAGFDKVYSSLLALATQREAAVSYGELLGNKLDLLAGNISFLWPLILFIFLSLMFAIKQYNKLSSYFNYIYLAVGLFIFANFKSLWQSSGFPGLWKAVFINLTVFLACSWVLVKEHKIKERNDKFSSLTVTLFFLIPLFFYLFYYSNFQTEYWMEFWIPSTLFIGYFLHTLYKNATTTIQTQASFSVVIISLGLFASLSGGLVIKQPQRGTFPVTNLSSTIDRLNKNFKNENEIFTGAAIIPYLSGKELALNISHPAIYCNCTPVGEQVIDTLFPKEEEIIRYLERKKIRLILVEKITRGVYMTRRPRLREYIENNYEYRYDVGVENPIEFWVRKNL